MYVFDVQYRAAIGYVGWTVINTLFLTTDAMLLEYIVRHAAQVERRNGDRRRMPNGTMDRTIS